jgi:hypothetical protein
MTPTAGADVLCGLTAALRRRALERAAGFKPGVLTLVTGPLLSGDLKCE